MKATIYVNREGIGGVFRDNEKFDFISFEAEYISVSAIKKMLLENGYTEVVTYE